MSAAAVLIQMCRNLDIEYKGKRELTVVAFHDGVLSDGGRLVMEVSEQQWRDVQVFSRNACARNHDAVFEMSAGPDRLYDDGMEIGEGMYVIAPVGCRLAVSFHRWRRDGD